MSDDNETTAIVMPLIGELERVEKAQIDQLIATAKAYPRNIHKCKEDATALATMDVETARESYYSLRRGGKLIEGPSVRTAEIVKSCWGNLRSGSRVLDADEKTVTAQAFCHDLERNVFTVKEVKRRITDKNGKRYNDDMIIMTGNAAAAVAHRNAVFDIIPKSVVNSVYNAAKKVAVGDAATLKDRWAKCIVKFSGIPVSEDQILVYLGKASAEEITPEDLAHMFGVFTSLREGHAVVDELFPPEKEPEKPSVTAGKVVQKAAEGPKPEKGTKTKGKTPEVAVTPLNEPTTEPVPELDSAEVVDNIFAPKGRNQDDE